MFTNGELLDVTSPSSPKTLCYNAAGRNLEVASPTCPPNVVVAPRCERPDGRAACAAGPAPTPTPRVP
jgi:hypothetical protein